MSTTSLNVGVRLIESELRQIARKYKISDKKLYEFIDAASTRRKIRSKLRSSKYGCWVYVGKATAIRL